MIAALAAIPARTWAWIALGVACLGLVWAALHWHGGKVTDTYNAGVSAQLALQVQALALARQRGASDTKELQGKADADRHAYNEQMATLGRAAAGLAEQLRSRTARPTGGAVVPDTASSGQGCTGAQLYREDATAFAREAGRADRLGAALTQCYKAYDAARNKSLGQAAQLPP